LLARLPGSIIWLLVDADEDRPGTDLLAHAGLWAYARTDDAYVGVYAATITVHRVWKGNVSSETTVYFVPNVDGPFLRPGVRQVVFARPLTEGMRKMYNIDARAPDGVPWVTPCSGVSSDDAEALKQLGRSRSPSPK
jgi:hypothetical protein